MDLQTSSINNNNTTTNNNINNNDNSYNIKCTEDRKKCGEESL